VRGRQQTGEKRKSERKACLYRCNHAPISSSGSYSW
jgi:hypothetical protein